MAAEIKTFTSKTINFDKVEKSEIDIVDIAHALSLTCRFNGHIKNFYSVAEHSVLASYQTEIATDYPEILLFVLLHDASEAYLNDIVRPVKHLLPDYLALEEKLQAYIELTLLIKPLGIPIEFKKIAAEAIIKYYDSLMLIAEQKKLKQYIDPYMDGHEKEISKIMRSIKCLPPIEAEKKFISRYKQLFNSACRNH